MKDIGGNIKKFLDKAKDQNDNYIGIALLLVKQAGQKKPEEPGQKKWDVHSRSQNFNLSLMNLTDAGYYLRRGG